MRSSSLPSLPHLTELGKSLLAAFASPFMQTNRLFTLRFAEDSDIAPELLLPHHLRGVENISSPFFYQVQALSPSVYLQPDQFLGQPVRLALLTDDDGERLVAGVVTAFVQLSSNGGMALYELHIEPCLATLAHSYNAVVRQDLTVDALIRDVLDHHRQNNPIFQRAFDIEFRLAETLPTLSYSVQHESDLRYIERLIAQYGLYYFFEFKDQGGHPVHVMVVSDAAWPLEPGAKPILRFAGANAEDDTVTQWRGKRSIQPGMVSLTSFEYKSVKVDQASAESALDQGKTGNQLASTLHDFDPQSHFYTRGGDDLHRHAQMRQEAHDFQAQRSIGVTGARGLALATTFELRGHPVHDQEDPRQRSFAIVSLACEARNNLAQETEASLANLLATRTELPPPLAPWFGNGAGLLGDPRQRPYGNVIECVQRDVPIRLPYAHTDHAQPPAPPMLTATVIGPEGEEVYTDDQGRVQIEYDFEAYVDNLAPGSAAKTRLRCWVRVLSLASGNHWGAQFIPRIGMEVLVVFLHGSWERMICIGALPNGTHPTPHFSGVGSLPSNKAQSGFKGKEHHGSGYNQLVLDDTNKQVNVQLMSTHANTQLNQGWLGTARRDGRSEPRGEGVEVITQAAAALRSIGPLLLTTEPARPGEIQLMRRALMQILSAALSLTENYGDLASALGANQPETGRNNQLVDDDRKPGVKADTGHQTHLKESIDNLERGYNNDPNGKTGHGEQRGGQGVVAISAVHGAAIASQKSVTVAAATNIDQTALRDNNQTTGRRWIHNVRESVSLFVDGTKAKIADTFKIIAAKGNVKVQAQSGKIDASAQNNIEITSINGKVLVTAPEEILLAAGGGYIRIGSNIEIHNPGNQSQKAAHFTLTGPANMPPNLPPMPNAVCKECLKAAQAAGSPFALT
jgi:type VI secretion system secreted protein VgrG